MNKPEFHDTSSQSVAQRESFSNTIVLLSMVKSEHYYIIGFSRPQQTIEVAFDCQDVTTEVISQSLILDYSDWKSGLKVTAELKALPEKFCNLQALSSSKSFILQDGIVRYNRTYPNDAVLPYTVSRLNRILLATKDEILDFLNICYSSATSQPV